MKKLFYIIIGILALMIGVTFTLKNPQEVVLSYYFGIEWVGPLSWLLISTFLLGVICGIISVLFSKVRRKLFSKKKRVTNVART